MCRVTPVRICSPKDWCSATWLALPATAVGGDCGTATALPGGPSLCSTTASATGGVCGQQRRRRESPPSVRPWPTWRRLTHWTVHPWPAFASVAAGSCSRCRGSGRRAPRASCTCTATLARTHLTRVVGTGCPTSEIGQQGNERPNVRAAQRVAARLALADHGAAVFNGAPSLAPVVGVVCGATRRLSGRTTAESRQNRGRRAYHVQCKSRGNVLVGARSGATAEEEAPDSQTNHVQASHVKGRRPTSAADATRRDHVLLAYVLGPGPSARPIRGPTLRGTMEQDPGDRCTAAGAADGARMARTARRMGGDSVADGVGETARMPPRAGGSRMGGLQCRARRPRSRPCRPSRATSLSGGSSRSTSLRTARTRSTARSSPSRT